VKFQVKSIPNFSAIKLDPITIFILSVLISICFTRKAISQPDTSSQNQLPPIIKIGVRNPAKSIGRLKESGNWGGFCSVFGQKLQNELKKEGFETKVEFYKEELKNAYIDRYRGLEQKTINIECGPNTILTNEQLTSENWGHVQFSAPFHTTGIKVLLKKENYSILKSLTDDKVKKKLKEIGIAVIKQTTTFPKLKNGGYNPTPYITKEESLKNLEKNPTIGAYASDALILKTLLVQDYNDEDYTLFPKEPNTYLPGLDTEKYGMAILKGTSYENILLTAISETLNNMEKERKQLEEEESAKSIEQIQEEHHQKNQMMEKEHDHVLNSKNAQLENSVSRNLFYSVTIGAVVATALLTFVIQKFLISGK